MILSLALATLAGLLAWFSIMSLRRGFWPRDADSTKWYDRAASASVGILLLLALALLLFKLPDLE